MDRSDETGVSTESQIAPKKVTSLHIEVSFLRSMFRFDVKFVACQTVQIIVDLLIHASLGAIKYFA